MLTTRTQDRANAAFKKQERVREGTKAMAEYQDARLAEDQKTERLKSLRLASVAIVPAAPAKHRTRST